MTSRSSKPVRALGADKADAFDVSTIIDTCLDLGMTHAQAKAFADRSVANRRKVTG